MREQYKDNALLRFHGNSLRVHVTVFRYTYIA